MTRKRRWASARRRPLQPQWLLRPYLGCVCWRKNWATSATFSLRRYLRRKETAYRRGLNQKLIQRPATHSVVFHCQRKILRSSSFWVPSQTTATKTTTTKYTCLKVLSMLILDLRSFPVNTCALLKKNEMGGGGGGGRGAGVQNNNKKRRGIIMVNMKRPVSPVWT